MIHSTAIVDPEAIIGENVHVGAFTVIGPDVEIGSGTRIGPHSVIEGPTKIGQDNHIFQFCSLGAEPQHRAHKGEPTRLEIGDRNVIREFNSMHRGTMVDKGLTKIGDDNMLMAYCHIAHDCVIGNQITMANGASLAGHVHLEDFCILGGFALVAQFCRVGPYCYLGFGCGVSHDVPPYLMVSGYPAKPHGINKEGLRRRGISAEDIQAVHQAYKTVYRRGLRLVEAREALAAGGPHSPVLQRFVDFIAVDGKHAIIR